MEEEQARLLRLVTLFAIGVTLVSGLANLAQGLSTGGPVLWSVGAWGTMTLSMLMVLATLKQGRIQLAVVTYVTAIAIGVVWIVLLETPIGAVIVATLGPLYAGLAAVAMLPEERHRWWRWGVGLESMLILQARHAVRPLPAVTWHDLIPASIGTGLATFAIVTFVARVVDQLSEANLEKQRGLKRLKRSNRALEVAHDRALAASNAKAAFLAHMSHELRTPLNAVLGYSELLAEQAELDEDSAADVQRIAVAANHLLSMISDVLDLSRVEAGQHRLTIQEVDVGTVCDEVRTIVAGSIEAGDNTFVVEAEPGQLLTDPVAVRQILINLLENAARFTTRGTIRLTAVDGTREGRLGRLFQVSDTGTGIEPDFLQVMFEPFTTTDGTGIGLTLSRALAESLGGTLDAQSVLGAGSTFRLWIPDLGQSIPDLD